MDYHKIKNLKGKLIYSDIWDGNKSREDIALSPVSGTNPGTNQNLNISPISKYNYFVFQYNYSYNIVNGIEMESINSYLVKIYNIGHTLQNDWIKSIIFFIIFPGIILILRKITDLLDSSSGGSNESSDNSQYFSFFNFLFNLDMIVTLTICIVTLLTLYLANRIYNNDKLKISNPFLNMIYHPDICKLFECNNKHLKVQFEDLIELNLTEHQLKTLSERAKSTLETNSELIIEFMVYNQNFINYYGNLGQLPNVMSLHLSWLIFNLFVSFIFFIKF